MRSTDIITELSDKEHISQQHAAQFLNSLLEIIQNGLMAGERVNLTGFGTFEVLNTKARIGTNPHTKQKIRIPPGRRITFRTARILKTLLQTKIPDPD